MNRAPTLALPFLLCLPALAGPPPAQVAKGLVQGEQTVPAALAAFQEAGVRPDQALRLLREVRRPRPEPGASTFELADSEGRSTEILAVVPAQPRADGRYGVLIVLHGLGGNARQLLKFAQSVAPAGTIVAAPNAVRLPPNLENDDLPRADGDWTPLPHWWRYHREGFPLATLRYLKRRYPIDTDRVLLTGYSMGGYGTWGTGLRFPDTFAAIAPLAGGISRLENFGGRDETNRRLLANARGLPSFFVHGDNDRVVPVRFSRTIRDELKAAEIPHVYREVPGGPHILRPFLNGNDLTEELAGWLAERVRQPWPKALSHTVIGDYHGRRAWLRIDRRTAEDTPARLSARIDGNHVRLEGDQVSELTLFLSPRLLDLEQPVRVTWQGRVLFVGYARPSLEAVLESWREREDPELLAPALLRLRPEQKALF